MELLQNYSSGEDSENPQPKKSSLVINSAPDVDIGAMQVQKNVEELTRFYKENEVQEKQNHLTGFLQTTHIHKQNFEQGFVDYVKDEEKPKEKSKKQLKRERRKMRESSGDPSQPDWKGPWATYQGIEDFKDQKASALTDEQNATIEKYQSMIKERLEYNPADKSKIYQKRTQNEDHKPKSTTVYHGNSEDKKFLAVPSYLKNSSSQQNFIPKKWVHTLNGHSKGVQKVKFFPKSGHLILSASHDGTCKIWDTMGKKCLRTYMGHQKSIRDIEFTNDGRKFLSASYDRQILLWDTEYGKVIHSFSNKKMPFCVKFHPSHGKQNIFLAGTQNKKILQYDINSKDIVQQYEEHMGSVNTITFIENGKKFVSTSDDKKIFVWEFGIPVVAKHLSSPDMTSIPSAVMHPNGMSWAGQSMNDKILIYDCKSNFKLNSKKQFSGHQNHSFACGLKFSPDGQFLASGDGDGKMWFWDWKTCKNYRTIKVHDGVCMDVDWHPLDSSTVVTCGWDSTIKLWN